MGAVRFRMNISFDALVPKRGGNGEPQISKHEGRPCGGLRRAEWLLVAEQEPPLGSHVVTPRCGYQHHGIYVAAVASGVCSNCFISAGSIGSRSVTLAFDGGCARRTREGGTAISRSSQEPAKYTKTWVFTGAPSIDNFS